MRKYLLPAITIIVLAFSIFGTAVVRFITDWYWFDSVGYLTVFRTILFTRIGLGVITGLAFFAVVYLNLWLARKIAPPPANTRIQQQLIEHIGKLARRGIGVLMLLGSVVVSAFVGLEANAHWMEWLTFSNAVGFGSSDPVMNKDIGFYVLQLGFVKFVYARVFFALIVSAIATTALYFADEAITGYGTNLRFARGVKAHLSILVALVFFAKAVGYRISMFDLLNWQGTQFGGAGFSQVYGNLPGQWILIAVAVLVGLMVLLSSRAKGIRVPIAGLVTLVASSLLVGAIYPELVRYLIVKPNELEKELPFIKRGITATQTAYGLANVAIREYPADDSLTAQQIASNRTTIDNIRLWDKSHLLDAYSQIQTIQPYFHFNDVDVDRYWLAPSPGKPKQYRQVWLAARELNPSTLPTDSQTWVNTHLQYTHGYGFCMSPVNEATAEGEPKFFVQNIPPKASADISLGQMGVYFGEMTDTPVLVKTNAPEFDYITGTETATTTYSGNDGVGIGGLGQKLLFAALYSDVNILLNDNLGAQSKMLFRRQIVRRVHTVLPFLRLDPDPYLVTVDGRLYWMIDAYTSSDNYPYSKLIGLNTDEGSVSINYVRNSVKIVVDAYNGTIDAYVTDKPLSDPIIQTYQKMFPGIFKPIAQMPAGLAAHIRYPEELFRIQTLVYEVYHMSDPRMFYNKSDMWETPKRAELVGGEDGTTMDPYYVIMKLPNGDKEEFILMTPYGRAGRTNMVAWMCAKCDGSDYGRLVLYQFPKGKNVAGPLQIAARARQDTQISQQLSLWNQQGSTVSSGNLLVVPIESSLLYVMPLYLESTATKIPELKRVIVALGGRVAMERTLDAALSAVVGETITSKPSAAIAPGATSVSPIAVSGEVAKLVSLASSQFQKAQEAQSRGDWAEYGRQIDAVKSTLAELRAKAR